MEIIISCTELTSRFPSSWIVQQSQSSLSLSSNNHLVWSLMERRFLKHRSQWVFLACQHYHLLLHPNQENYTCQHPDWVCWIWRGGIKATQGTGTWLLGPINASSNLNFSHLQKSCLIQFFGTVHGNRCDGTQKHQERKCREYGGYRGNGISEECWVASKIQENV